MTEEKKEIEDILAEPDKDDLDIEEAVLESDESEKKEELPEIEPKDTENTPEEAENEPQRGEPEKEKFEEPQRPLLEKVEKKKGSGRWKLILTVIFTVLATAAIVLGLVYFFVIRKDSKKSETPSDTTKTEEVVEKTEETTEPKAEALYVNATDGLRLRKEPNVNADILDTMPYGTKLTPLGKSGDWIKVEYNGKTGWCMSQYTSAENPLVYTNTTYGFQITFPAAWATYRLFPIEGMTGSTAAYYVGIKTTDTATISSGVDQGYYSAFAVSVYTKEQWTAVQAADGPKDTLATEGTKYVIGYSTPNGVPPSDMTERTKEVKSIIATIKFI